LAAFFARAALVGMRFSVGVPTDGRAQRAINHVLAECKAESLVRVNIEERDDAGYGRAQPGGPSKHAKYNKETRARYHQTWELGAAAFGNTERKEGIFPLLMNER